jgi:hypothetical protein
MNTMYNTLQMNRNLRLETVLSISRKITRNGDKMSDNDYVS